MNSILGSSPGKFKIAITCSISYLHRKNRNVVPFPTQAESPVRTKRADTALIRECVIFAQSVAAYDAGLAADPDRNSVHAERFANQYLGRANEALAKISQTPASTAEGLQAKARIVPVVISNAAQSMDDREEAFFLSFGADVKAFLETVLDVHRRAERAGA